MDLAVAYGVLYLAGKHLRQETAPIAVTDQVDDDDLKLAKKFPEENGREQFLYEAAQSSTDFPGTARIMQAFRKAVPRERQEHENQYDPLIGNVRQTSIRPEYLIDRYHSKQTDYKDSQGRMPETNANGQEP